MARQLSVAPRSAAVAAAVYRPTARRRCRAEGVTTTDGRVPGVRRRQPRNAGRNRHHRTRTIPRGRRRIADARAVPERRCRPGSRRVAALVQRRTSSAFGTCAVETRVRLRDGIVAGTVHGRSRASSAFRLPRLPSAQRVSCTRSAPAGWHGVFEAFAAAPAPQQAKTVGRGFARRDARRRRLSVPERVRADGRAANRFPSSSGSSAADSSTATARIRCSTARISRAAGSMVVVTINYRLGVWGFVPVRERNVGLARSDRRVGLGEAQHRARSAATPTT